jgi:hypothetical protein
MKYTSLVVLIILLFVDGTFADSNNTFSGNVTIPTNATAADNATLPGGYDKQMEAKYDQYSLPYGVFGAISHILTYWSLLCHAYGRRPLFPWQTLKKKPLNACHVVISSIVSITIAIVTLSRVRETAPLVVLAALQIVIGFVVDALNVHRYLKQKQDGLLIGTVGWGAILYVVSYATIYATASMTSM